MDFLTDLHSMWRWVVLAGALGAGVLGLIRAGRGAAWDPRARRPYALAAMAIDLQVTLGIILWIGTRSWEADFFIKVIHPLAMLAGLGVAHGLISRAGKVGGGDAHRFAGAGLLGALVVIAAFIPRDAWF